MSKPAQILQTGSIPSFKLSVILFLLTSFLSTKVARNASGCVCISRQHGAVGADVGTEDMATPQYVVQGGLI